MTTSTARAGAAIALSLLCLPALSGCAAVDDMLHKQETATFADKAAFDAGTKTSADWLPADSTDITERRTSDDSGVAVILLTSKSKLPDTCKDAERRSAPTLNIDGAPDIYDPKNTAAHVCGDWTVMKASDGWYGWTPNAEDKAG